MTDPGLSLAANTVNGKAREHALASIDTATQATSLVAYRSNGHLLIIGAEADAVAARERVPDGLACTLLSTTNAVASADDSIYRARLISLRGHLGAFVAEVDGGNKRTINLAEANGIESSCFDLVLDLSPSPLITSAVPPPGYFAPAADTTALDDAIAQIPELVGEFEKPKYFEYDPSICAHSRSGIAGCRRCIDACPTDAIISMADGVEVNPYLCQGGGSCATACPSGAIRYALPGADDLLESLRQMLRAYRDAEGDAACVLFYDREHGHDILAQQAAELGGNVLPIVVEEIGSVGLDVWLAVLAYGAERVMLLAHESVPAAVRREVDHQLGIGHRLLAGMGYPAQRLSWMEATNFPDGVNVQADAAFGNAAAGFAGIGGKRAVLRMALDHLHDCASASTDCIELPDGAPFGAIRLDIDACTLCMACVSVCPAGALEDGGDSPALRFIEWNCVQCGICESACPEHAIRLEPRYLLDAGRRLSTRELKSEEPFRCVQCGKAFATPSVIRRMHEKLAGHWMFKDASAMRRLEMCEDCRVKDMFTDSANNAS